MSDAIGKGTSAAERLRQFIERIELITADQGDLAEEKKSVFAQAKSEGYEPKAMRKVLKVRAMGPADREEQEQLEDVYLHAMGLERSPDLAAAVELAGDDVLSRAAVMAMLHRLTPTNGSLELEVEGKRTRLTRDLDGTVTETAVTGDKAAAVTELPTRTRKAASESVPDCDREGAELLGRESYKTNQPITRNPFPRGDDRRERWDKGWRAEMLSKGGDA
jgi:uncharacterized protein (UPF0335 family)